ncbi:MAG: hypothetical protein SFU91_11280 [Chloroherpetonaceae bacterium]|nr:hypothetical protein [Chloroherpetonaceae bacterium]
MSEIRGGVITQVLYSIGVVVDSSLDAVTSGVEKVFNGTGETINKVVDSITKPSTPSK